MLESDSPITVAHVVDSGKEVTMIVPMGCSVGYQGNRRFGITLHYNSSKPNFPS